VRGSEPELNEHHGLYEYLARTSGVRQADLAEAGANLPLQCNEPGIGTGR
jgi:hypothetical protein